jgi:RsiG-like
MSVEVVPGGQRRIDRVLDPRFAADVGQLDLAELRARREEVEAEEADISYLRRLLQGRLDILRAELVRRSRGGEHDVAGLLAGLPEILSDEAPGTFSAIPRIQVPSRADQHRRRVERLVSDETIARLPELDVEELTRAVEVLAHEEESVSTHRRSVQRVVDVLRGELARRYRNGSAQISELLE